jgi:uncharacterized protein YcbX
MRVAEVWRYPVKSLRGERLERGIAVDDGFVGDRSWGILDVKTGRILTGRREPRLLFASATVTPEGAPRIALPSGDVVVGLGRATDAALSAWLGQDVQLVAATESPAARAEFFADATDDTSDALEWTMPKDRFVDAMPLLLLTTAGLRAGKAAHPAGEWNVARFRPNILVELDGEGWLEDDWRGRTLRIGSAALVPRQRCKRCTMVTRAQPGLPKDVDIYRALARTHGADAGVWSSVITTGVIAEGDAVVVEAEQV